MTCQLVIGREFSLSTPTQNKFVNLSPTNPNPTSTPSPYPDRNLQTQTQQMHHHLILIETCKPNPNKRITTSSWSREPQPKPTTFDLWFWPREIGNKIEWERTTSVEARFRLDLEKKLERRRNYRLDFFNFFLLVFFWGDSSCIWIFFYISFATSWNWSLKLHLGVHKGIK